MKRGKLFILAASLAFALGITNANADKTEVKYELTPETQQAIENIINVAKSDKMAATNEFFNFLEDKKYKKELRKKEALTVAGQQLFKAGLYQQAAELGRLAYETDGGYYPAIMLCGDAYYELKNWGEASAKYDEAMNAEKNEKAAYLKTADVYKYINADRSLEVLQEFKKKFPTDPDVNKAMGDIYFFQNEIDKALEAYNTYFAEFKGTDVVAEEKYAIILFAKKDYQQCYDKVMAALAKDNSREALNRMKFFSKMELLNKAEEETGVAPAEKIQEVKEIADKYFTMFIDTLYNGADYKYKGQLAKYLKDNKMMVESYEKAVKADPENTSILKGLSDAYEKVGEADKSVETYQKILKITSPDGIGAQDYLNMGKIYYRCAQGIEDSTKNDVKKKYVAEGEKLFAKVEELAPSAYFGPLFRARIQLITNGDNATEEIKNCYERALKAVEGKDESYNDVRIESLRYAAFFHYQKGNKPECKEYCNQVLALDPNNGTAKAILGAIGQ